MASSVAICNLALTHLGDTALISAIDPPDGSVQAARCSVYYPQCLQLMLEGHAWSFNTARTSLALSGDAVGPWAYRYARPSNALRVLKVLGGSTLSTEESEDFVLEVNGAGDVTILTDTEDATALYTIPVTDTTKFTAQFEDAFSWLLASFLAGPIIKGEAGVKYGEYCYKRFQTSFSIAVTADASQHNPPRDYTPGAIGARA